MHDAPDTPADDRPAGPTPEDRVPSELFDEDYLYFYETFLTPAHDDADAELLGTLVEVRPGDRVLDAPCGHGRMARRLAAAGALVTGVDRSEIFLERARADARQAGLAIDYRAGDLRRLPVDDGAFDVAVNWYTSFGYFDDAGNAVVAAELFRGLRPGGRLCIDIMNPAALIRSVPAARSALPNLTWRGADHLIDETTVELEGGLFHTRHTIVRAGRTRRMRYSLRFYFPTELRALLRTAGFEEVRFVGDDGGPLEVSSHRMIVLARRPAT
jgi:SAM-dependent methyltransferase